MIGHDHEMSSDFLAFLTQSELARGAKPEDSGSPGSAVCGSIHAFMLPWRGVGVSLVRFGEPPGGVGNDHLAAGKAACADC